MICKECATLHHHYHTKSMLTPVLHSPKKQALVDLMNLKADVCDELRSTEKLMGHQ
jgi:hypothetical protein